MSYPHQQHPHHLPHPQQHQHPPQPSAAYPQVPYGAPPGAPPSAYPPVAVPPPHHPVQQQPPPVSYPATTGYPPQGPHGYPASTPPVNGIVPNYATPPYPGYAAQPPNPVPPLAQPPPPQLPLYQQQYPPPNAALGSYYGNVTPYPASGAAAVHPHHQQQQSPMYSHHQHSPAPPPPSAYPSMPYSPTSPINAHQHPATLGVQLDMYGLPFVPGDPPVAYAQKYRVEEKIVSTTRDSFNIYDQNGTIRYKVDGLLSINERKVIKDMNNNVLLKLKEARMKLRDKITVSNAHNVPVLTLQKASAIQIGSKRVNGYLGGRVGGLPALVITGNYNNTRFHVVNSKNMEMADISRRKYSLKNVLTDQDTYDVTIHCGSAALLCFITVAIDEIYED